MNIHNVTSGYCLQILVLELEGQEEALSGGPRSKVDAASCPLPRPTLHPASTPTEQTRNLIVLSR